MADITHTAPGATARSESYRSMKFGGSSVGRAQSLRRVVEIICREREDGPIAVVVSAMGDTTDWLIDAARAAARGDRDEAERIVDRVADLAIKNGHVLLQHIESDRGKLAAHPEITPLVREVVDPLRRILYGVSLVREMTAQTLDLIMSFGERLSANVVAQLVTAAGTPAVFVDARDWTVTDDTFGTAVVDWDRTMRSLSELRDRWGDRVPIHTGFLGRTVDGRTTTLGRNGSDYTATLLARALNASEVNIWTDVSGVMTADPGIVVDAYPLQRMSYMEALELANFGARMFHPRTMIPLVESGIPMRIRNTTDRSAPGTRVDEYGDTNVDRPTSVTSLENLAWIGVEWRRISHFAQIGARVLAALDAAGITCWMANQAAHGQAVAVVVPHETVVRAQEVIERELALELSRGEIQPLSVQAPVTLLSLVAEAMGKTANVAGRFFHTLGGVGVNIRGIAQGASSRSISCVIDADDTDTAVRTAHAAFNFAHQPVSLYVLGKGVVGGVLLEQIRAQQQTLESEHDVQLNVVGIADSKSRLFESAGVDLAAWATAFDRSAASQAAPTSGTDHVVADLAELRRLPVPVLVDCTAADGMEALYEAAFKLGIHVVAANKKALTSPLATRNRLMETARTHHRVYRYETTVGASLPVIDTLKNLVRTGDTVVRIEGSFSGTLGYLTNELMSETLLSAAVSAAKTLGYTEPHPRDDLSGLDVARKALILAREVGLDLELSDVHVEPLVPAHLLEHDELDAFFDALRAHDASMADTIATAKSEQKVLRYLATIDPSADVALRVAPTLVSIDHPAAHLRGSEAL